MTLSIVDIPRPMSYPPRRTRFTRHFWDRLSSGRFETTKCSACGRFSFPPKPFCPHCWSQKVVWTPLSGRGKIYSRTVVHAAAAVFSEEVPLSVCIVDLDEGVRLATRLVDGATLQLDDPVQLLILRFSDGCLYGAAPA